MKLFETVFSGNAENGTRCGLDLDIDGSGFHNGGLDLFRCWLAAHQQGNQNQCDG